MPMQETEKARNDIVDLMIDACGERVQVRGPDDNITTEVQLNEKKVWWKTHIINSNRLGRFAFALEFFEGLAQQCQYNMTKQRANVIAQQIMHIAEAYRYSIDAKSSEAMTDKNNKSMTLVHILSRNKQERHYTIKDEVKQSMWEGFVGKDVQRDAAEG